MGLNLKNRKIIISGASDGIGRALALAFAKEGAQVAVCARNQGPLDTLSAEIEGEGHLFFSADLGKAEGVQAFHENVMNQWGHIDVLINNVGAILKLVNFFELTDQDWEDSFQINLMSAVRLTRLCIPALKQSACAAIINISSIAAASPQEVSPHSSAMKAGLSNLTVSLAKTLAPEKIRVNAISPGAIATPIFYGGSARANTLTDAENEAKMAKLTANLAKAVPLQQAGLAVDIAEGALYLASDASRFVTSHDLVIDGGRTAMFNEPRG